MDAAAIITALFGESLTWEGTLSERLTRLTELLLRRHLPESPAMRILCVEFATSLEREGSLDASSLLPALRRDIYADPVGATPVFPPYNRETLERLLVFAQASHERLVSQPGEPLEDSLCERLGEAVFRESEHYRKNLAPLGVEDVWVVHRLVGERHVFVLLTPRMAGRPALSEQQKRLVSLYAEASCGKWVELAGRPLQVAKGMATQLGLSRVRRDVLGCVLAGLPEDLIAVRVDRSPHTVHNHLRDLYKLFQVSGRSELQALIGRTGGGEGGGPPGR